MLAGCWRARAGVWVFQDGGVARMSGRFGGAASLSVFVYVCAMISIKKLHIYIYIHIGNGSGHSARQYICLFVLFACMVSKHVWTKFPRHGGHRAPFRTESNGWTGRSYKGSLLCGPGLADVHTYVARLSPRTRRIAHDVRCARFDSLARASSRDRRASLRGFHASRGPSSRHLL